MMTQLWPEFVLASLAVWRISHLLACEDGPFDLVVRLRMRLGDAGRTLDCFHCTSLWVAAPMAWIVGATAHDWWLVWLALSGTAGLLYRLGEHPAGDPAKGNDDGLLWTEAGRAGEPDDGGAPAGRPDRPPDGIRRT